MSKKTSTIKMLILGLFVLALAASNVSADIQLPAGTEVKVAFVQDISSKYVKPGDLAPLRLLEPIEVGGVTLVKEGASGTGRVVSVKSAGKAGSPGEMEIELVELEADGYFKTVDNKTIKIEAVDGNLTAKGKGKKLLSYIFIFGLFIKGGEAVFTAGQPINAAVAEDVMIVIE